MSRYERLRAAVQAGGVTRSAEEEALTNLGVVRAVGSLSELDAEIVLLAAWEGLDSKAIGSIVGLSGPAVRMRLSRAKRSLVTFDSREETAAMTDPFKETELMGQESRESGEQWATGPAGRSVLDQIIQSDPAKHDIRITDVADRTRRVPAIAASVVLVVLIAGGAAFIRARDGGDLVDADRTSEPDRGVGVGPSGLTSDLPVGAEDSPYWVAHELPDGYAIGCLDAQRSGGR